MEVSTDVLLIMAIALEPDKHEYPLVYIPSD